jgi:hypothetical protein
VKKSASKKNEKNLTTSYYAYLGPLGEVVRHGAAFFASKDGFLIGTYDTLGELWSPLSGKKERNPSEINFLEYTRLGVILSFRPHVKIRISSLINTRLRWST